MFLSFCGFRLLFDDFAWCFWLLVDEQLMLDSGIRVGRHVLGLTYWIVGFSVLAGDESKFSQLLGFF